MVESVASYKISGSRESCGSCLTFDLFSSELFDCAGNITNCYDWCVKNLSVLNALIAAKTMSLDDQLLTTCDIARVVVDPAD